MSALDFDRTLPPIMPERGDAFNSYVRKVVDEAGGDEAKLVEIVVPMARQSYFADIVQVEYPGSSTDG